MNERRRNWYLPVGFLLSVAAFATYPLLFARFPMTRDIPWVNLFLFVVAIALLVGGLIQTFAQPGRTWIRIVGVVAAFLSLAAAAGFCFLVFYASRQLPPAAGAPRVGEKAPEFALVDTNNQAVTLAGLLSTPMTAGTTPPKGVLLVFYRGHW